MRQYTTSLQVIKDAEMIAWDRWLNDPSEINKAFANGVNYAVKILERYLQENS